MHTHTHTVGHTHVAYVHKKDEKTFKWVCTTCRYSALVQMLREIWRYMKVSNAPQNDHVIMHDL